MAESLASVTKWLTDKLDEGIWIRKEEQDDLDEVRLQLEGVAYRDEQQDALDEYTSDSALLLYGHGTLHTDGHEADLPTDTFEIPLQGLHIQEIGEEAISLVTARAIYTISVH